jgi:hypothetical protein
VAETETIVLAGWPGGLNRESDPLQVEANELAEATNVDLGLQGAVSKRKGYTRFDTPSYTAVLDSVTTWRRLGGSEFLVAHRSNGQLVYGDVAAFDTRSTSWSAPTGASDYPVAYASLGNTLYVSSLRGNTQKFDGTTWTSITDNTLNGSGTEFPRARHLVSLHERVFAFNVDVNAGRFRSRMYFSNAAQAETWEALDWIDFQPDDGQEITAASAFGESIIVFKNNSIHLLSGTDPNSFTRYPVDSKIGCESPGTVVPDGNVIRFFDFRTGVWEFDGASFQKIDDKINSYLLSGTNVGQHHKAVGFVWMSKYYLSVPWGTDEFNSRTFVYDTRTKAWTEWTVGFSGFSAKSQTPYVVGPKNAQGLYTFLSSNSDNGVAIPATVKTGWVSPKTPAVKYRTRRLDVAFSALGNFDVEVSSFRDFNLDVYQQKTVNTSPGGMEWGDSLWGADWGTGVQQIYSRNTGWGKRWRTMAIGFEEGTINGSFQVNRVVLHLSSLGTVRGSSGE